MKSIQFKAEFESLITTENTHENDQAKVPPSSNRITTWNYDMQVHVEQCPEAAKKNTSSLV